jgi:chorismate synthase
MLRYWTAGESHGKALLALVDGFPAGVTLDTEAIDAELRRRQGGYGRGGRQQIEQDHADLLSGIRRGVPSAARSLCWCLTAIIRSSRWKTSTGPGPVMGT